MKALYVQMTVHFVIFHEIVDELSCAVGDKHYIEQKYKLSVRQLQHK